MNQKSLALDSPLLFIYFNFFYIAQIVVLGLGTRCPPRDPSLPVSCSPAPHHVFPEGPLDEHGRNAVFLTFHDISSKTRASASRVIAELWLGSRISFTTSMHAIAAHHSYATLQVIDKEPLLARWFGEIHQNIVIRTVSSSVAIISYLRQVLTIHLLIPLFSIHRILKKRFGEPIIIRWNEKNTDDKQSQYSQYNQ